MSILQVGLLQKVIIPHMVLLTAFNICVLAAEENASRNRMNSVRKDKAIRIRKILPSAVDVFRQSKDKEMKELAVTERIKKCGELR
jgi:hypothetical protein